MESGSRIHHRIVLAIEATAASVQHFPLFRRVALEHLNELLFQKSFEVIAARAAASGRACLPF
jgi:hypothetical protein